MEAAKRKQRTNHRQQFQNPSNNNEVLLVFLVIGISNDPFSNCLHINLVDNVEKQIVS